MPFNFSFSYDFIQNNLGNIEWIENYGRPYLSTKNIDAIANIFFFIPLGIIIYNVRSALGHKRGYIFDIALATLSGLFLSLIIELSQLFIEERRTSVIDILMNTLGCFSGAILGYIFNQILSRSSRQKISGFIRNVPVTILIIPFLLISFFISEKFSVHFFKSKKIENISFNWDYMFRPLWIWLMLYVYIPIGVLITRTIRNRLSQYKSHMIYIISFMTAVTIICIVEYIKFFSHTTSEPVVNIIFGIVGIIIGIAFSTVLITDRKMITGSENRQVLMILTGIFIFFTFIIFYKSAYPFELNYTWSYLFDKLLFSFFSVYSFIPFNGFDKLFLYSIQNILLFLPVGILLCEMESYINQKKKISRLIIFVILLILIPFIIKILNQNLIPFLYEIPTNLLGLFMGYFIWFGFTRESQIS